MGVWRCANCKYRLVSGDLGPCKTCNGKNHWKYYDPEDIRGLREIALKYKRDK